MHSNRMRITRSSTVTGAGVSMTETPLDRYPLDREPPDREPPDKDPIPDRDTLGQGQGHMTKMMILLMTDRQTDTCENITLPQISFAYGNNSVQLYFYPKSILEPQAGSILSVAYMTHNDPQSHFWCFFYSTS